MQITIQGTADYKPAIEGWKASRDEHAAGIPWQIAHVDAPVNELPSCVAVFEGFTILEREIFFSARNHVAWSRTSRVDDPLQFQVPVDFFDAKTHESYRNIMRDKKAQGIHQDQWRMYLPLVSVTSWTARLSFRDLVRLHKYFLYLAEKEAIHFALRRRFAKVAKALYDVALEIVGSVFVSKDFVLNGAIEKMQMHKLLCEDFKYRYVTASLYEDSHFNSLTMPLSVALRAQIVRHREIIFTDSFYNDVLCHQEFWKCTIGNTIELAAVATHDIWANVIGKRACWIAQADLWQPLVDQFDEGTLPCSGGICPFTADAEARLVPGKDPGAPCPRYCNLNKHDKAPYLSAMNQEAVKRGKAKEFWQKEIAQ